jgi:hypothetical protein
MLSLKHIIEIAELVPGISVKGISRETVFPHDLLEIEGSTYRVDSLEKLSNNTWKFTAKLITTHSNE